MIPPEFQAQVIVCTNGKVLERMEMIEKMVDLGWMDGESVRKKMSHFMSNLAGRKGLKEAVCFCACV